jgi:hypothetical protein
MCRYTDKNAVSTGPAEPADCGPGLLGSSGARAAGRAPAGPHRRDERPQPVNEIDSQFGSLSRLDDPARRLDPAGGRTDQVSHNEE